MLILGVIIGLLIAVVVLLVLFRYQTPIQRTLNQQQSKMAPKGVIIEPENNEVTEWLDTLPNEVSKV